MTDLQVVLAALPVVLLVVGHGAPPGPVVSDAGAGHQAPAPLCPRHPQRGGGPAAVALEPPSQLLPVNTAPPEHSPIQIMSRVTELTLMWRPRAAADRRGTAPAAA